LIYKHTFFPQYGCVLRDSADIPLVGRGDPPAVYCYTVTLESSWPLSISMWTWTTSISRITDGRGIPALDSFATPELERYTMRSTPISTLSCESRFRYLSCPAMCVLGFVSKHTAQHEARFGPEVHTFPCIRTSVTNCVNCSRSLGHSHKAYMFFKVPLRDRVDLLYM
jgi:hypothetical protein